jgi:hypothetical protein
VSFRLVRTCSDGPSAFSVLVRGNFQGPPSNDECRCSSPNGPTFSVLQVGVCVERDNAKVVKPVGVSVWGGKCVGRGRGTTQQHIGNHQGPPSNDECRCSSPNGPTFSVLQVGVGEGGG